MATKKSKSSKKSTKATSSTKSKSAAKTAKKPELEAPKTEKVEKTVKTEKVNKVAKDERMEKVETKEVTFKTFFAKKYEEKESILTIFKKPRFFGTLLGELLGTMLLTLLILSLWPIGLAFGQYSNANIAIYALAIIAIIIAISKLSETCLNPLVTVGMMATRRMSVIRGIMYIVAEIIGALLGLVIINAFKLAGGETAMDMPAMSAIGENGFWLVTMVEFVGAIIISFFFARARQFKRSIFTFAAVATGGLILAYFVGFIVSAAFLGLNNNFVMNPAVALTLQIFPSAGESFGEILGSICQALSIYAIIPMIGGVVGFYISDLTNCLSSEK